MTYPFSGPSISGLPFQPWIGLTVGYTIGHCVNAHSPALFGAALAVHQLADILIYTVVNSMKGDGAGHSAQIYATTNFSISVTTMGFLYCSGLIGQIGVIAGSVLIGIELYTKYKDLSYYRTAQLPH